MFGNPLELRSVGVTALTVGALVGPFAGTASAISGASPTAASGVPSSASSAGSVTSADGARVQPRLPSIGVPMAHNGAAGGLRTTASGTPGRAQRNPMTAPSTTEPTGLVGQLDAANAPAATPPDATPGPAPHPQATPPPATQPGLTSPGETPPAATPPLEKQPGATPPAATPPPPQPSTTSPAATPPATPPPATYPVATRPVASRPVVTLSLSTAGASPPPRARRFPSAVAADWQVPSALRPVTGRRPAPAGGPGAFPDLTRTQTFPAPLVASPRSMAGSAADAQGLRRSPKQPPPIASVERSGVAPLPATPVLDFAPPDQTRVPIGGATVGASGGIGTAGPPAIAFVAVLVLVALGFLPKRLALNPVPWRSTLLAMRLERPG
jgi:hypothetical protein